jgi:hypothetical protein
VVEAPEEAEPEVEDDKASAKKSKPTTPLEASPEKA